MLVLASASPRRKELLTQAGYTFQVIPSSIPEDLRSGESPTAFVTRLAREKAQAVYGQYKDQCKNQGTSDPESSANSPSAPLVVVGADTIVVIGGAILGKPRDRADAARMLRLLSGHTHQVITGVCLLTASGDRTVAETTSVTMRTLTDQEITEYIATGEPMDKAGAYAIQGYAARWIPRIEGCYFNVVGLPLALVSGMIEGE